MTASISTHSTNIASTIIHAYAYHYNLSLCMCHVQPTVYQRNSYCIHDIPMTEAIRSYTPISHAPLINGIPFTHADILIVSCACHSMLLVINNQGRQNRGAGGAIASPLSQICELRGLASHCVKIIRNLSMHTTQI